MTKYLAFDWRGILSKKAYCAFDIFSDQSQFKFHSYFSPFTFVPETWINILPIWFFSFKKLNELASVIGLRYFQSLMNEISDYEYDCRDLWGVHSNEPKPLLFMI